MASDSGLKVVWHWRQLSPAALKDPNKDERSSGLIRARCNAFKVSKEKVYKVAASGKTKHEAVTEITNEFNDHLHNESQLITSFQNSLQQISKLRETVAKLQFDLNEMPDSRKFTTGKSVTNVPSGERIKQNIILFFAVLFTVADCINYTIFFHEKVGNTWLQAALVPIGGVVGLAVGIKLAFDIPKREQPKWFKTAKILLLIVGVVLLGAWAYLNSQYAMIMANGPVLTGLDGAAKTVDHSSLMLWFSTIGLACIAAFSVAKAQEITDRFTDYDGITESQEYLQKNKLLYSARRELESVSDRKTHTDSLMAIIDNARDSAQREAGSFYDEYRQGQN